MAIATRRVISRRRRRRRSPLRPAALVVFITGLFLVLAFMYSIWHGVAEQQRLNQVWSGEAGAHQVAPLNIDPSLQRPLNGVDFAIRVPRLGYFAAVREGIDSASLYSGPGHYPSTMWPGEPGTVGVAAHNVYWVNFPQLQPGDEIDVQTRYGIYRYHVTGSVIVNPDDRTVLVPDTNGYHLTLTTCWPLWAGAFATQRYVIFAKQVWPVPVRPGYV